MTKNMSRHCILVRKLDSSDVIKDCCRTAELISNHFAVLGQPIRFNGFNWIVEHVYPELVDYEEKS